MPRAAHHKDPMVVHPRKFLVNFILRAQLKEISSFDETLGLNDAMFTAVISFNIALAILCLIVAWKLHHIKNTLRRATRWLINAEQNTDQILYPAPYYILLGQAGIAQRQRQVAGIRAIQQQVIRFATLLKLLQWIYQRQAESIQGRFVSRAKRLR